MKYIRLFENFNDNLIEIKPNKFIYHISNPYFRDKISKEGLIPKSKSETWLSDTKIDDSVIFASNSNDIDKWFIPLYDDDIYRIDTTNLNNKWFRDPNSDNDNWIITFDKILPEYIELIYKGTGEVDDYRDSEIIKRMNIL